MTLDSIRKILFYNQKIYFIDTLSRIKSVKTTLYNDRNNCISEEHIEKWLLLNDLMTVAIYFNHDWIPDWNNRTESKYIIKMNEEMKIVIEQVKTPCSFVYFKNAEDAKEAVQIIGEKCLKIILE